MTMYNIKEAFESIKKIEGQVNQQSEFIIYPRQSSIAVGLSVAEWKNLLEVFMLIKITSLEVQP